MSEKIVKSKFYFEEELIETVGKASTKKYKTLPPNSKLRYVGKEIDRKDAFVKVTGRAKYTFDIELPGMLHAKTLRSPYPHAIIESIDDSAARKIKGVYEIIHAFNTEKINWYGNSLLFDKHLRYEGDEIACVAAKDEKTALLALSKIKVKYKILDFAVRAEESIKSGVKIHSKGNVRRGKPDIYERGNISHGFEQADFIIEDEFSTEVVIQNPTEPHCSVVEWKNNKLTVYDSTQAVFNVRGRIADALGLKENEVRVIKKYMGGGFGSKLEAGKYSVMAAILSKKTGKPVKIVNDRREQNLAVGNRPDSIQKLKIGVKKDGTFTAFSHKSWASIGAYPAGGGCSWPLRTLYKCPNVRTEEYSVYTNTGRARPFRAPGHVQGTFAFESIIDEAANKLQIDPIKLRVKNYTTVDPVGGNPYTQKLLREAYKLGAQKIGWKEREKFKAKSDEFTKYGMGMASQIWWGGGGPPAHVRLEIDHSGRVTAFAGSQDIGTGTYTFVSQVIGEVLQLAPETIDVVLGDTDVIPYGPGSGGSTTAPSISPACRDAAERMKELLINSAAVVTELPENDLYIHKGKVLSRTKENIALSFKEIIQKLNEKKLVVTGSRESNPNGFNVQTFGAQFAKVAVDILTGQITVQKIVAVHDIGRVLNKKTLENQFHGGIVQGLGFALMEEQIVDNYTGKVLNANFHDYKVPTIKDIPEIEVYTVGEYDEKANNMGVKGIGEPAIIPTAAAIANAVSHALDKRVKSLPMTPDKILNLIYGEA